MSKQIIFVEDNKEKAQEVYSYITDQFNIECTLIDSYRAGLKEIILNDYDIVLLDMSLPTWEKNSMNSIENYEKLGGYSIMHEMKRKKKIIPTILITMFQEFGVGESFLNYKDIDKVCQEQFSGFFIGSVYYSSKENIWKKELSTLLEKVL